MAGRQFVGGGFTNRHYFDVKVEGFTGQIVVAVNAYFVTIYCGNGHHMLLARVAFCVELHAHF
jgi:hypothetical protein